MYLKRKDLRTEMVTIGAIGGLVAFTAAPYFFGKYWSPVTLFNFKNSIEDFLFGFFLCSESAGIYGFILNKRFENYHFWNVCKTNSGKVFISIILNPMLFFVLVRFTKINPIYCSMISTVIPLILITVNNKVRSNIAAFTGVFIFLYTLVFYLIFNHLFPGIISNWWNLNNISGILVFGIPIEELIWFTAVGMFCSVTYKFITNSRVELVN